MTWQKVGTITTGLYTNLTLFIDYEGESSVTFGFLGAGGDPASISSTITFTASGMQGSFTMGGAYDLYVDTDTDVAGVTGYNAFTPNQTYSGALDMSMFTNLRVLTCSDHNIESIAVANYDFDTVDISWNNLSDSTIDAFAEGILASVQTTPRTGTLTASNLTPTTIDSYLACAMLGTVYDWTVNFLGTSMPTIGISNVEELQAINYNLENTYNYDYNLLNDIDCSVTSTWNEGNGFAPIHDALEYYSGEFNGNGYTISNLTCRWSGVNYVGLFGIVGTSGHVFDFTLSNADILGSSYVGGVCGRANGVCHNIVVDGSTVEGTSNYVGGAIGYTITSYTSYKLKVRNSSITGAVYVGGVSGFITHNSAYPKLQYCIAHNNTISGNSAVGGICGDDYKTTTDNIIVSLIDCLAYLNTISSSDVTRVGSIIGYQDDYSHIERCHAYDANGLLISGTDTNVLATQKECSSLTLADLTDKDFMITKKVNFLIFSQEGSSYPDYRTSVFPAKGETDIYDIYELQSVRTRIGYDTGDTFKIMNNIDASCTATWNGGAGFITVGDDNGVSTYFDAEVDGQGFYITDLTINATVNSIGIFGLGYSHTYIHDLELKNSSIISTGMFVGGFVGRISYGARVENCISNNNVVTGSSFVGGIIGLSFDDASRVQGTNLLEFGCTLTGNSNVGGICGRTTSATFKDCISLDHRVIGNYVDDYGYTAIVIRCFYNTDCGLTDARATGLTTSQLQDKPSCVSKGMNYLAFSQDQGNYPELRVFKYPERGQYEIYDIYEWQSMDMYWNGVYNTWDIMNDINALSCHTWHPVDEFCVNVLDDAEDVNFHHYAGLRKLGYYNDYGRNVFIINGNGHTISNILMDYNDSGSNNTNTDGTHNFSRAQVSPIWFMEGGACRINDLKITGTIKGFSHVSGFIGAVYYWDGVNSQINNCSFEGYLSSYYWVGGFARYSRRGSFKNCTVDAIINTTGNYGVGLFANYVADGNTPIGQPEKCTLFDTCIANVVVTGVVAGDANKIGFVNYVGYGGDSATVAYNCRTSDCYMNSERAGSSNNYVELDPAGAADAGFGVGTFDLYKYTTAQMKDKANFAGLDFIESLAPDETGEWYMGHDGFPERVDFREIEEFNKLQNEIGALV